MQKTMGKLIVVVLLATLLSSLLVAAVASDVRFALPTPIVKDVPFYLDVELDSNGENVMRIQLYTTSQDQHVDFLASSLGGNRWLANNPIGASDNTALDSGKIWFFNIPTSAPNNEQTVDGTFRRIVTLRAQSEVDGLITLTGTSAPDNTVVHYPDGTALGLSLTTAGFTTVASACGDGVVGYIDSNTNGAEDPGEVREACDDGNGAGSSGPNYALASGSDGCSADCKFVDISYSCTNTAFGDRNSVCTAMGRARLFREKMSALFQSQCYPNNVHPGRFYSFFCDGSNDGPAEINSVSNANLIGLIGNALVAYLTSPATNPP